MKQMISVLIVLLVAVLVTACAGPAPTATQVSTESAATATQLPATATEPPATETSLPATATEPAMTEPAVTEPATATASTQGIPQTGNGTQVNVTLKDNSLSPSMFTFKVGVPYTFVITNIGNNPHSFNINPPVSVVGTLDGARNNALLAIDEGKLEPGETVTVQFTFPVSAAGRQWEFSCLNKRHYEDGMHVSINVVK